MFIVFEGLEKSGKSTLSIAFTQHLNHSFDLAIDPHFGDYIWTKEPSFTPEVSRQINNSLYMDEFRRERIFFESRIRHQNQIAGKNVVCERYLWSGLTYASIYSSNCFKFLKELYTSESLFIHPDLYVFVETPPEVCCKRDPSLDIDIQEDIFESYANTKKYIRTPIITIPSKKSEKESLNFLISEFESFCEK